jgi:ubiquinone/menaquinone biosynthesis C-methylase UbiE
MNLLKEDFRVIEKKGIKYVADENGMPLYSKPWIGNFVSFLYDFLMKKVVFPGNLSADYDKHEEIIRTMLKDIKNKRILELAAGSGYTVDHLSPVNDYVGTDISPGLLKIAKKKFEKKGFRSIDFYVLSAENIPFKVNSFDVCICILSLNFFGSSSETVEIKIRQK